MRVIDQFGNQLGIMPAVEALATAYENGLDLVEVSSGGDVPVCKIMDHSKHLYEQGLKEKAARRNAAKNTVKEIKFRPGIDDHDYETKRRQVEKFLVAGDKVRVSIMLRGREQSHPELGRAVLTRLATDLAGVANIDSDAKVDGRNIIMMLAPQDGKSKRKASE